MPHGAVPAPLEQDRGDQVGALVTRLGQAMGGGPLGPGEIHRVESAMRSVIRISHQPAAQTTAMLAISDIRGQSHHSHKVKERKILGVRRYWNTMLLSNIPAAMPMFNT